MLAPDQTVTELTLPAVDVRALARRASVPALAVLAVAGVVVLGGGPIHAFADAVGRGLDSSPQWALLGIGFECVSLAGYVALLSLVATRATPRIGARESAQITLAGAAATRLLPTAGAGGAALAMWVLRRAGLRPATAVRTLLAFLVLLYAVFLAAIAIAGSALALGLVHSPGPVQLSAIPAAGAVIVLAYLVGQVANIIPLPGAVSGGMVGVLVTFGSPLAVALPAVVAYRLISVWIPFPAAVAAVPRLRATLKRWVREDRDGSEPVAAAAAQTPELAHV